MKKTVSKKRFLGKGSPRWRRLFSHRFGFLLTLCVLLSASIPFTGHAGETAGRFILQILAFPLMAWVAVIGGLLWVCGYAITFLLNASFDVVNYLPVTVGWQTTRDVINMMVVLFLLVIIFATLFRVEQYYKGLLPRLILAVVLVNFSRTITSVLIEASNVFTRSFMPEALRGKFTETMLGAMGIGDFWNITPTQKFDTLDAFTGLLFNVIVFTAILFAFLGIMLMFFTRLVALMFLTILSPIAFLFNVLPATKEYANMWWK